MKNYILLFVLFIFTNSAINAQIVIYRTYQDYLNKKGEKYDQCNGYLFALGKLDLKVTINGKKESVPVKNAWGFTYRDSLFRIKPGPSMVMVYSKGKMHYYENGYSHFDAIMDGKRAYRLSSDQFNFFLSKSLDSEIKTLNTTNKGAMKKLTQEFPDYSKVFECVKGEEVSVVIRKCVFSFEGREYTYDRKEMINSAR